MKNSLILSFAATLLTVLASQAQQSPSPAPQPSTQPQQTPSKTAPCSTAPAVPKRLHFQAPAWLQKQINKQQAKTGGSVDVNGAIQDATKPAPCPPAKPPAPAPAPVGPTPPAQTTTTQTTPKQ